MHLQALTLTEREVKDSSASELRRRSGDKPLASLAQTQNVFSEYKIEVTSFKMTRET